MSVVPANRASRPDVQAVFGRGPAAKCQCQRIKLGDHDWFAIPVEERAHRLRELRLHHEVEAWYLELCESDPETADLIEDAIDRGRACTWIPLADRVNGSRYYNMKELRPPSAGSTDIRMLFAFDPRREATRGTAGR